MKKIFVWFFMLLKRTVKNPIFFIVSMITPVIAISLTLISKNPDVHINVAVYSKDSSEFATKIIDSLTSRDNIFRFTNCNSYDEALLLLERGDVSCVYVLPNDFESKLSGETFGSVPSEIIEVISTPSSDISIITNEVLYSHIVEVYAYSMLADKMADISYFSNIDDAFMKDKLYDYYNDYMKGTDTFSFEYNLNTDGIPKTVNIYDYITTPMRGIAATIIFITALCGGFILDKDKKNKTFGLLGKKAEFLLSYADIFIPTFISGIISVITLYVTGITNTLAKEGLIMLLYVLLTSMFALILKTIIKSIHVYSGTIPLFIMGSLVFCPVFINIATFFPALKFVQMLFMPNYYLLFVNLF